MRLATGLSLQPLASSFSFYWKLIYFYCRFACVDVDTHSVYVGVGGHLGESPSNHTRPGEHAQAVEVSRRPLPCRGLLLFSGTAFLSKKDERALMFLEFFTHLFSALCV